MWRSRMFWQLFSTHGILVLFSIVLPGMVAARRDTQHVLQQIQENLKTSSLAVQEAIKGVQRGEKAVLLGRLRDLASELSTHITLIRMDGKVLVDTNEDADKMENHSDRPEVVGAGERGFDASTRFSATLGTNMMYGALRAGSNDWEVAYVRVAVPLSAVQEKLASLQWRVWTAAGLTAVLALGLAFWLARRITKPVQELTAGAQEIAAGGYGHRVAPRGGDEVGRLARTFNHMSERLADQFTQLDDDRQQLRAVLSSMVEGVVALDGDQRILFANERAGQLLDFPTQSVVGRHLGELVRHRPLLELVQQALGKVDGQRQELTWSGPGPRSLAVHVGHLPGIPPRGIVLVFHDTTDLRRLERLRQEFVANVSHELKTPLSVITACVETLIDGAVNDPENRGRFLDRIADQAERLHHLILDLLSLARIETETEAFVLQAVSLEKVVAASLERHRTLADARNQILEVTSDGTSSSAQAWADEEAVRQILDNLVDNALKYTPEKGTVRVRLGQDDGQVFLQVQDTGIGIPEAELTRIFERFYRVDKARSRELGGTGLGLSIVKHLTQAMQGSVSATSKVGQGSTFTVRLPAWPAK
jgi:two-component system phosphate regulon sensor histidine kinase PhoR